MNTKNGSDSAAPDTQTTSTYAWWDAAQQSSVAFKPSTGQSTTWTSTYAYDQNGHLTSVNVADGRPRNIAYVNDASGQVLSRTEADTIAFNATTQAGGDPKQLYYYFDGKQVGANGNNGNDDPNYATQLTERTGVTGTGAFRRGFTGGIATADFDQSYDPVNASVTGGTSSAYAVRQGDVSTGSTQAALQSIAQAVFGDASLWYLIADANGLNASSTLVAGTTLTALFSPAPTGSFAADFVNGAISNTITQGVAIATGLQHRFDFAGVAIAKAAYVSTKALDDVRAREQAKQVKLLSARFLKPETGSAAPASRANPDLVVRARLLAKPA